MSYFHIYMNDCYILFEFILCYLSQYVVYQSTVMSTIQILLNSEILHEINIQKKFYDEQNCNREHCLEI